MRNDRNMHKVLCRETLNLLGCNFRRYSGGSSKTIDFLKVEVMPLFLFRMSFHELGKSLSLHNEI